MNHLRLLTCVLFIFSYTANGVEKSLPFFQWSVDGGAEKIVKDEKYFTIAHVKVKSEPFIDADYSSEHLFKEGTDLGTIILTLDKIMALGKKVWAIIEGGRPIVQLNLGNHVSVLPYQKGETDLGVLDLDNWSSFKGMKYTVTCENLLGLEVIRFTYIASFQHNGEYLGKGKYLSNIQIVATDVEVAWGYDFNAETIVRSLSQSGSKDDPVAEIVLSVSYKTKNVLKETRGEHFLHITGLGEVESH